MLAFLVSLPQKLDAVKHGWCELDRHTLEIACTRCATTPSLNGRQALLIVRRPAVEIY